MPSEMEVQQVCFSFQVGLVRDKVTVDIPDLTLKYLKTLACSFVNEKFPEHEVTRLAERLMVFRHDYAAETALQVGGCIADRGCSVVEIVGCSLQATAARLTNCCLFRQSTL